jgi:fused signal recognition particle receptor
MFNFLKDKFYSGLSAIKKMIGFGPSENDVTKIKESLLDLNFSLAFTKNIIARVKETGSPWAEVFRSELERILPCRVFSEKDFDVAILLGINGSGKTTSAIKLARKNFLSSEETLLIAADTFRAAAINQLETLAKENKIPFFSSSDPSPATVIFKGAQFAKEHNFRKVVIDTAGRIHQNMNLLKELKKSVTIAEREFSDRRIKRFLVLDGFQGKNMLEQAKIFKEYVTLDGIILTKLDSEVKPGVILSVIEELDLPVVFLGFGQQDTDLVPFVREEFINLFFE